MKQILLFVAILFLFTTVQGAPQKHKPVRIALTVSSRSYINFLRRADSTVITIDLKGLPADSAVRLLSTCNALLLTGGEDVAPAYYGKPEESERCEINGARDTMEMALIKKATELHMPILGICRGEQILNVALGGSLVVDIPSDRPSAISHRCEDFSKCRHSVTIDRQSFLYAVCKSDTGTVTTAHHQAVNAVAPSLKVVAHAPDGINEAVEWQDPAGKPFLLAVQWHPERMPVESRLSTPIAKKFMKAASAFKPAKRSKKMHRMKR